MRNDSQRNGDGVPRPGRGGNGIIPNSLKAFSSYLRIVSSGASTVASSVRSAASAASAIVERDCESNHDQVSWAGFDKLELERGVMRQVLLLGYTYGFQVWDVEAANNVHNLVSRHDGPVSFMQMLPKPLVPKQSGDKFADNRPLLVVCADASFSGGNTQVGSGIPSNRSIKQCNGSVSDDYVPLVVWFYSLRTKSYVHLLRFRSVVHLVRCSSRVVAVLQSTQIHCFNAGSLEREYTILTNPVATECYGPKNMGFGPLAVGPRWMAYSGSQVACSNDGRVSPQHLNQSPSIPSSASNGSLVAHYAKESSKQIAAGIVTLGDMGYKKLSRYYSDLLPEGINGHSGTRLKVHGVANGHLPEADSVGMVIVRDIVSKTVIAQFRAHRSPISFLCFDPSGTLLVTASVQGHNINVFHIMPGLSGGSSGPSYVHLYRLQRGLTNAVIRDISFSCDSQWIMISSSRGTSHLFAISHSGGPVNIQSTEGPPNSGSQVLAQQGTRDLGSPVTLSAISRIRSGNSGWRNTVSGAAAAATGRMSSLSGAIASAFHNCKDDDVNEDTKKNYYLLVFSPTGCMIQYDLRVTPGYNGMMALPGVNESGLDYDPRLIVEAMQKWNICQKQNRKDQDDNIDLYGEIGNSDSSKVYPERTKQENNLFSDVFGTAAKGNRATEGKYHNYMSEHELQIRPNRFSQWARSEIYFQSFVTKGINIDEESESGGEIETERIPVHTLEARPKVLVPVFDYLRSPNFQQRRIALHSSGQLQPQAFNMSEDEKLEDRSNLVNESDNGLDGKNGGKVGLKLSTETSGGFVNTNDTNDTLIANPQLKTVNTRETPPGNSQHRFVHNIGRPEMENQSAESDEFG